MGLFGGDKAEKGGGEGGDVIDLGRKVEDLKKEGEGAEEEREAGPKDERLQLLGSVLSGAEGLREAKEAKDTVSSLVLKMAVEKPWLVELQLLKLYEGIDPKDSRKSLEMFSGEVKYMRKKVKAMKSEIKGAEIDDDARDLALKNIKKFLKALDQIEDYLENLMDLSDKERKDIDSVDEGKLSGAQKRVLKDRKRVSERKKFLADRVKEEEEFKARMKKLAAAA